MSYTDIDSDNYVELSRDESEEIEFAAGAAQMKFAAGNADKFIVLVNATDAATNAAKVTIESGDFWKESQGDLEVISETDTSGAYYAIGPLNTARFKDSNGDIKLKLEAVSSSITEAHTEFCVLVLP